MHLTAATVLTATKRAAERSILIDRHGRPYFCSHRTAPPVRVRHASIFRSCVVNFLVRRGARLHYSVIVGRSMDLWAAGIADGCRLGAIPLTTKSQRRTSIFLVPVPPHEAVISDAETHQGRSRFRTGGRKIYTNDRGFSDTMQVDISVANGRMMRIGEKLSRDVSQYATVAPILHRSVHANPTDRGTTFSTGAADAAGR